MIYKLNAEERAIAKRELEYFRLTPQTPPEREAGKTAQADLFGGPKVADLEKKQRPVKDS